MEDKKMQRAEADLKKAEADLKIAEEMDKTAIEEVKDALEELKDAGDHEHEKHFEIQIDRKMYKVKENSLTGLQLRGLPSPPIASDRDLFEVVPGGTDLKIANTDIVVMRNGLRFFSAPSQINPGRK